MSDRNDLGILGLAGLDFAATEKLLQSVQIVGVERRDNVGIALIVVPVVAAAMIPGVVASDRHFEDVAFAPYEKPGLGVAERKPLMRLSQREIPFYDRPGRIRRGKRRNTGKRHDNRTHNALFHLCSTFLFSNRYLSYGGGETRALKSS